MSLLEIIANVFNLASVVLAARNSPATWSIGIIGCVLYGFMFYGAKLYADVTLQFFFVGTSAYGWWDWTKGGPSRTPLPISRVRLPPLFGIVILGFAAAAAYGAFLDSQTDASFPFVDSLILAFSVVAQILLMKRKLETWPFWLVVNTIAVPLYATKELYLTSAIYAVFWINAVWGFSRWRAELIRGGAHGGG